MDTVSKILTLTDSIVDFIDDSTVTLSSLHLGYINLELHLSDFNPNIRILVYEFIKGNIPFLIWQCIVYENESNFNDLLEKIKYFKNYRPMTPLDTDLKIIEDIIIEKMNNYRFQNHSSPK